MGWLDGVLLRYAVRLNGLTELVVTKLDVLSGLDQINICDSYRVNGQTFSELPMGPSQLGMFEPVFTSMPGWRADITGARKWSDLPEGAQAYIHTIEQIAGIPVTSVSVGPERDQVVEVQP